jgi:predicted DNA-binding protein YlxM (UPF0122 family)
MFLTVKEYSEKYKISRSTIYKRIKNGQIKANKKQGKLFIFENKIIEPKQEIVKKQEIEDADIIEGIALVEKKIANLALVERVERVERVIRSLIDNLMAVKNNKDNKDDESIQTQNINLKAYLIKKGFSKKFRQLIFNRFNKLVGIEERIIQKDDDYFLDFSNFNYDDLLEI